MRTRGSQAAIAEAGRPAVGYRADIDGLRAVAVMLVVLNHTGMTLMRGGFIGVDVFFVISGFLITALITRQQASGSFQFGSFYLRRAQRLLPALYAMMLVVMVGAFALLTPADYSRLAASALSATVFASNIFFAATTGGYFAPDAGAQPLLHIWSLSVEEQFYLLWPAILLVLLRVREPRVRIGLTVALTILSFAWGQRGAAAGSIGAYFLLPGRAGEFLVGALVQMLWQARGRSPLLANAASGIGLALILASSVALNEHTPFPGVAALLPCAGAALIIAAPQFGDSVATRLLSSRPFVWVGLISYSVYLWHWPIVSFLHSLRIPLTAPVAAGVVAGSLTLGAISWWLLERRFRVALERFSRPALAVALAASAAALAGPAYIYARDGLPERFPYALLTQDELTAERSRYWIELPSKNTTLSADDKGRQLLIIGDSHAYDLAYAMNENGFPGRIKLIETFHHCFNFGLQAIRAADAALCAERLTAVMTSPELPVADIVYLHDHWGRYDEQGLRDMIRRLRTVTRAPIYVFGPKNTFTDDVLAISKRAQDQHIASVAGINRFAVQFQHVEKHEFDERLRRLFAAETPEGARYVSTLEIQCGPARTCDVLSPEGRYLYFDAGHFTLEGSRRYGQRLKAAHPELF